MSNIQAHILLVRANDDFSQEIVSHFKEKNIEIIVMDDICIALSFLQALKSLPIHIDLIILDAGLGDINASGYNFDIHSMFKEVAREPHIIGTPAQISEFSTQFQGIAMHCFQSPFSGDELFKDVLFSLANVPEKVQINSAREQLSVLVAEDDEAGQIIYREILTEMGLGFKIVDSGDKVLDVWRTERPDLILMDVEMPVMNGISATKIIRKEGGASGTPIVGVTAHVLGGDRERFLASGMDDYLSKPISPKVLRDKINKWLRFSKARNSA